MIDLLIKLLIVMFTVFASLLFSGALLAPASGQSDPGQAGAALAALLTVSVLNASIFVRKAHLLETATSNFLFGWLIVLVLCARREPMINST